jgi:hypothetical protein
VPLDYQFALLARAALGRLDAVVLGWPDAAQDRRQMRGLLPSAQQTGDDRE